MTPTTDPGGQPPAVGSGSTVELVVTEDLDAAGAFRLETRFDALLAARDPKRVVLDLADVGFVDSSGLGVLLAMHDRAGQLGVDLAISRVSDNVRRILDLTGLSSLAGG